MITEPDGDSTLGKRYHAFGVSLVPGKRLRRPGLRRGPRRHVEGTKRLAFTRSGVGGALAGSAPIERCRFVGRERVIQGRWFERRRFHRLGRESWGVRRGRRPRQR